MKIIRLLWWSIGLLACIECHSSNNKNLNEQHNVDADLSYAFQKYSNNSYLMNSNQLVHFLNQFQLMFLNALQTNSSCLSLKLQNLLNQTKSLKNDTIINRDNFNKLCLYLISFIDMCFSENEFNRTFILENHHHDTSNWSSFLENVSKINKEKWLYALLSVTVISVAGLVCVLVVPLLNACCFDYLFQFLVALALGTLSGDALLHLIPHAFMEHTSKENYDLTFLDDVNLNERDDSNLNVYKGLGAFLGIYVFFIIEKLVNIKKDRKEKKEKKSQLNEKVKNVENDNNLSQANVFDNPNYSISPKKVNNKNNASFSSKESEKVFKDSVQLNLLDHKNTNNIADKIESEKPEKSHGHSHGHSHDHTHGHSHGSSSDMKSNAWMVIIGDGLHNFSDGLAIGASFATSVTAGFGTTIAVFCHELPHEIGDFAVLRRTGVSLKRAIFFNIISSILCFVGVVIGILIGGIDVLSDWSFLFIAGTFLYISLVDIIPELNETKNDSNLLNFTLQNGGILLGVGIMLTIGLFEKDIHNLIG